MYTIIQNYMLNLHVYKDILFVSMRNVPLMYVPRTCTSNVHRNARINETMQWYMTGIFLNIAHICTTGYNVYSW